jgi:hypothetical protein
MYMDKLHNTLSKGATGYLLFSLTSKDFNLQPLPPEIAPVLQDLLMSLKSPQPCHLKESVITQSGLESKIVNSLSGKDTSSSLFRILLQDSQGGELAKNFI